MSETEKSANLENARAGSHIQSARRMVKNSKPSFGLMLYLSPLDLFFLVAFSVAFVKDLLDWIGVGSIPAVGTAVTLVASFCIWAAMMIGGAGSTAKTHGRAIRKYAVLICGTIAEMLFGLNFLPVETTIVCLVFYFTLVERKVAAEENSQPEKAVYA